MGLHRGPDEDHCQDPDQYLDHGPPGFKELFVDFLINGSPSKFNPLEGRGLHIHRRMEENVQKSQHDPGTLPLPPPTLPLQHGTTGVPDEHRVVGAWEDGPGLGGPLLLLGGALMLPKALTQRCLHEGWTQHPLRVRLDGLLQPCGACPLQVGGWVDEGGRLGAQAACTHMVYSVHVLHEVHYTCTA